MSGQDPKNRTAKRRPRRQRFRRGVEAAPAIPGVVERVAGAHPTTIRYMAYGPDGLDERTGVSAASLSALVGRRPVLWIDVAGLADAAAISSIGNLLGLHALALEDTVHTHQRPKVEEYPDHDFLIARMLPLADEDDTDQLAMFLGKDFVVTFQERPGDCLDPVRTAIRSGRGRLRSAGADFLATAILDAVIDAYFPALEAMGEELDAIEDESMARPGREVLTRLYHLKRRLVMIRRAIWPLRDAIGRLLREDHPWVGRDTRLFIRDCYDHTVQIIDFIETYREVCANLMDVYLSSVSNRLNDIMKVLTIISTVFIPLTFIAGIYGMNFNTEVSPVNMPELNWRYGYLLVLGLMAVIAAVQLVMFWNKGWFGGDRGADRD